MRILYIIYLCLFAFLSHAECTVGQIRVFPQSSQIKANGLIMLEGQGEAQKIILGLNRHYPIFLESGNHKVELDIISSRESSFSGVISVLKPKEPLGNNKTYYLRIENLQAVQQGYLTRSLSEESLMAVHIYWVVKKYWLQRAMSSNLWFGAKPTETVLNLKSRTFRNE